MKAHSRFANYKFSRFENYATDHAYPVDTRIGNVIQFKVNGGIV